jgi:hypothetical protein
MEKNKVIVEFNKFIHVLEQNPSSSSKLIFHQYLGGAKFGEIFLILQSSITVSKQDLTIKEINGIFEQKIHSNSFLMPSDPEFTPILNYFFRNRDEFIIDREEIISFLQEKIVNLQNSIWIENHNVFSFGDGNSLQPDCTINFMKRSDNIAFIFQINNLNLIFNESKEISNLNKKISQLNKKIEKNNQKRTGNKKFEDKQVFNEKTIQKLKNALNSTKNEFKTKISHLYENLQRLESENAELLSENSQFKLETQRLSDLIQKIEQDNQNLIKENEEIDVAKDILRENLEKSNIKISDMSEEIKSLENLNSQLKNSNVQLSDQNTDLKVKIRKNTSRIKEILNEIDSFKGLDE